MASTATRGQIVTDALSLSGRNSEIKSNCNQWLAYFLKHVGITFRFPELRKTGSAITLAQGTSSALLPTDFGAGMEKSGLIFGDDKRPMSEFSFEEFATNNGYPASAQATGRPRFYMVDRQAGNFVFSTPADQAYSFFPVYFMMPPQVNVDVSHDTETIWLDNDLIAVQGLAWMIYMFTGDDRELAQEARVEKLLNQWKRETTKMGGTSRVLPSPTRFKNILFGGQFRT